MLNFLNSNGLSIMFISQVFLVISSKKTKIISIGPKKIHSANQVLCSEQNDENNAESETMHISMNQIKPVSPLSYSVARYNYL